MSDGSSDNALTSHQGICASWLTHYRCSRRGCPYPHPVPHPFPRPKPLFRPPPSFPPPTSLPQPSAEAVQPDLTVTAQNQEGNNTLYNQTEAASVDDHSDKTEGQQSLATPGSVLQPTRNSSEPQPSLTRGSEVGFNKNVQSFGSGHGPETPPSVGQTHHSAATRYSAATHYSAASVGKRQACGPPPAPSSPSRIVDNEARKSTSMSMAPATQVAQNGASGERRVGPHPSYIQVARAYVFEQQIQQCFAALGTNLAKEDRIRLEGVIWIDNVRRALQLPVRTFDTAVMHYHKFRLVHADNEYLVADAAAAALLIACKIEDTLKKSREILCAAYNLKVPTSDQLSPDDPLFEQSSKTILGLERLMLEASGFDFRTRYPQKTVMQLLKSQGLDDIVGRTAYNMSIDVYRTFAPLKQTSATVAIACVELAARICGMDLTNITGEHGIDIKSWSTDRSHIMETLLDLLDLYTHYEKYTIVGPQYAMNGFLETRITLNKEAETAGFERYNHWVHPKKTAPNGAGSNGAKLSPASPASDPRSSNVVSPHSPPAMGSAAANGTRIRVGERGRDGTVRFMLQEARARDEKAIVAAFFAKDEYEEVEEEVDVPVTPPFN
ncbi:hypothetical protein MBLNU459_g8008t1 [Dothideomycetes sp. NU459]